MKTMILGSMLFFSTGCATLVCGQVGDVNSNGHATTVDEHEACLNRVHAASQSAAAGFQRMGQPIQQTSQVQASRTCTRNGNYVSCSDGTSCQLIGNMMTCSDGSSCTAIGDTVTCQ